MSSGHYMKCPSWRISGMKKCTNNKNNKWVNQSVWNILSLTNVDTTFIKNIFSWFENVSYVKHISYTRPRSLVQQLRRGLLEGVFWCNKCKCMQNYMQNVCKMIFFCHRYCMPIVICTKKISFVIIIRHSLHVQTFLSKHNSCSSHFFLSEICRWSAYYLIQ